MDENPYRSPESSGGPRRINVGTLFRRLARIVLAVLGVEFAIAAIVLVILGLPSRPYSIPVAFAYGAIAAACFYGVKRIPL